MTALRYNKIKYCPTIIMLAYLYTIHHVSELCSSYIYSFVTILMMEELYLCFVSSFNAARVFILFYYIFFLSFHSPCTYSFVFLRSADSEYNSALLSTNVIVTHDGNLTWLSSAIFKSSCGRIRSFNNIKTNKNVTFTLCFSLAN